MTYYYKFNNNKMSNSVSLIAMNLLNERIHPKIVNEKRRGFLTHISNLLNYPLSTINNDDINNIVEAKKKN
jgi:hypothetical protein